MVSTATRASLELIEADDDADAPDPDRSPAWLEWLADADPMFRDPDGRPVVGRIARAGGMSRKTLYPIATRYRSPTLGTVGEIVAMGARLHGVSDADAMCRLVRVVHRPVTARASKA